MDDFDLLVVGGGIAGGSLATVMARQGAHVLVLERQSVHRDHVRGELLWPWGVEVARRLGVEAVLLDAGALVVRWFVGHDEGWDDPTRDDIGAAIEGVSGSMNLTHPTACAALIERAKAAGADVRRGVREVQLAVGARPSVRWVDGSGDVQEARGEIVVGADGRRSSIRAQAGIPLEVDPPPHFVAGMLVEGIEGIEAGVNLHARESDLLFLAFPQEGGRARLYLCFPSEQRSRFAGRDAADRFLAACRVGCLQGVADWDETRPAGPCATFPGDDSRSSMPLADGVVLIGDAAGYENPLRGQGLSMALRDVLDVSRALLSGSGRAEALEEYASARAVRQRLANLGTMLVVWANEGFAAQDPEVRAARYRHLRGDDVIEKLSSSFWGGYDSLPQDLAAVDISARLDAYH